MSRDGDAFGLLGRLFGRPRPAAGETAEEAGEAPPAPAPPATARPVQEVLAGRVLAAWLERRGGEMRGDPSSFAGLPQDKAVFLIKAMLAAGHADGGLDPIEARRIAAAAAAAGLDEAARAELEASMAEPPPLEPLLRQVADAETAARFYAVSVRAVRRGQATNSSYLEYLAHRLDLPREMVVRLNRRWDVPV